MHIEIRVEECLAPRWSEWLDGLAISHTASGTDRAGGETTLTGPIADQAALYGLIGKLRDLGLSLVSVQRVEPAARPRRSRQ